MQANRVLGTFLIVLALLILVPLTYSAVTTDITLSFSGQIAYNFNTATYYIGQYSNGTYYAVNQATQQTYATNPQYASALINNAMISTSQSGGGTVEIGKGSFLLNSPLIAQSNVNLQVSPQATIYQAPISSLAASISLLITQSSVQNFVVNGGTWNGNRGSFSDHRDSSTWNSYFSNYMGLAFSNGGSDVTVANLTVENVINSGINFYEVKNAEAYNCTILNAGDNPITFNGNTNGNPNGSWNDTAEYCTVNGGQDVGINTFHADNCTLRYNTVTNITQYSGASHWGIAAENSNYVNIIGNNVSDCDYDIESTSNHALIANNIAIGSTNTEVGIQVLYVDSNIVENNIVYNCQSYQSIGDYGTATTNLQLINNTVINSKAIWAGAINETISGGSINSPSDYNGGICVDNAQNVQIIGVTFTGYKGITDYSSNSINVYVANCNFTALTGTKISLSDCTNVTLTNNIGYP